MENRQFEILPTVILGEYTQQVSKTLLQNFEKLADSELSADTFSFYTSVSAVYSSKIEGEMPFLLMLPQSLAINENN